MTEHGPQAGLLGTVTFSQSHLRLVPQLLGQFAGANALATSR